MILKNCRSIGCIDYGNNNYFEVMISPDHKVIISPHDGDDNCHENPDGSWTCEGLTINEFLTEISDREDYHEIVKELMLHFE